MCVGAGGAPAGSSDTSTAALCPGRQCAGGRQKISRSGARAHAPWCRWRRPAREQPPLGHEFQARCSMPRSGFSGEGPGARSRARLPDCLSRPGAPAQGSAAPPRLRNRGPCAWLGALAPTGVVCASRDAPAPRRRPLCGRRLSRPLCGRFPAGWRAAADGSRLVRAPRPGRGACVDKGRARPGRERPLALGDLPSGRPDREREGVSAQSSSDHTCQLAGAAPRSQAAGGHACPRPRASSGLPAGLRARACAAPAAGRRLSLRFSCVTQP